MAGAVLQQVPYVPPRRPFWKEGLDLEGVVQVSSHHCILVYVFGQTPSANLLRLCVSDPGSTINCFIILWCTKDQTSSSTWATVLSSSTSLSWRKVWTTDGQENEVAMLTRASMLLYIILMEEHMLWKSLCCHCEVLRMDSSGKESVACTIDRSASRIKLWT